METNRRNLIKSAIAGIAGILGVGGAEVSNVCGGSASVSLAKSNLHYWLILGHGGHVKGISTIRQQAEQMARERGGAVFGRNALMPLAPGEEMDHCGDHQYHLMQLCKRTGKLLQHTQREWSFHANWKYLKAYREYYSHYCSGAHTLWIGTGGSKKYVLNLGREIIKKIKDGELPLDCLTVWQWLDKKY